MDIKITIGFYVKREIERREKMSKKLKDNIYGKNVGSYTPPLFYFLTSEKVKYLITVIINVITAT